MTIALLLSLSIGCLPTMSASITATITDNNQEIVPNASVEIRALGRFVTGRIEWR